MKCCSCSYGICEEKNCRVSFFSPCFSFSPIPLENRNGSTQEKKYLSTFFILFILPDAPNILGPFWKWIKFHKDYRQSMGSTNMAITLLSIHFRCHWPHKIELTCISLMSKENINLSHIWCSFSLIAFLFTRQETEVLQSEADLSLIQANVEKENRQQVIFTKNCLNFLQ